MLARRAWRSLGVDISVCPFSCLVCSATTKLLGCVAFCFFFFFISRALFRELKMREKPNRETEDELAKRGEAKERSILQWKKGEGEEKKREKKKK